MQIAAWQRMQPVAVTVLPDGGKPFGLQALLIGRLNPLLNSRLLAPYASSRAARSPLARPGMFGRR